MAQSRQAPLDLLHIQVRRLGWGQDNDGVQLPRQFIKIACPPVVAAKSVASLRSTKQVAQSVTSPLSRPLSTNPEAFLVRAPPQSQPGQTRHSYTASLRVVWPLSTTKPVKTTRKHNLYPLRTRDLHQLSPLPKSGYTPSTFFFELLA